MVQTGLDINNNGTLDAASPDRIKVSETRYEETDGFWWQVTTQSIYARDNDDTESRLSVRKERLTGLGENGLIRETVSVDRFGQTTSERTLLDRDAAEQIVETDLPDSDTDARTVTRYGLLVSATDKTGTQTSYGYDALGRRISTTRERTGTSTITYNSHGQVSSMTDAAGNQNSFEYDPATGRKISVTDALGRTTYYRYNHFGSITHTWGAQYPVKYEYDAQNRMTRMYTYRINEGWDGSTWPNPVDALADQTQWHYDPASGLLVAKEDALGRMTRYTYAPGGRIHLRAGR